MDIKLIMMNDDIKKYMKFFINQERIIIYNSLLFIYLFIYYLFIIVIIYNNNINYNSITLLRWYAVV